MVPSSASIAGPIFVLNTIVAEELCQIADRLRKLKTSMRKFTQFSGK